MLNNISLHGVKKIHVMPQTFVAEKEGIKAYYTADIVITGDDGQELRITAFTRDDKEMDVALRASAR